jgi:hypothetical protein
MSEKVRECASEKVTTDVAEVVDDALDDIERALNESLPPIDDDLGALAAQLVEEQEQARRLPAVRLKSYGVALDDDWATDDEDPTTEWRRRGSEEESVPPEAHSLRALLRYIDERSDRESIAPEVDMTPRPAAVSISSASEPPPRRRFPLPLAVVALISVGAAIVSYRLGPHSGASPPASTAAVEPPADHAAEPASLVSTVDYGAPVQTQRLMVSVSPADAHLAIRAVDEPQGERYTGPWPRAFDLAPGVYELVAFRHGQSVVSSIDIEPGVAPPPLALRIPATE